MKIQMEEKSERLDIVDRIMEWRLLKPLKPVYKRFKEHVMLLWGTNYVVSKGSVFNNSGYKGGGE